MSFLWFRPLRFFSIQESDGVAMSCHRLQGASKIRFHRSQIVPTTFHKFQQWSVHPLCQHCLQTSVIHDIFYKLPNDIPNFEAISEIVKHLPSSRSSWITKMFESVMLVWGRREWLTFASFLIIGKFIVLRFLKACFCQTVPSIFAKCQKFLRFLTWCIHSKASPTPNIPSQPIIGGWDDGITSRDFGAEFLFICDSTLYYNLFWFMLHMNCGSKFRGYESTLFSVWGDEFSCICETKFKFLRFIEDLNMHRVSYISKWSDEQKEHQLQMFQELINWAENDPDTSDWICFPNWRFCWKKSDIKSIEGYEAKRKRFFALLRNKFPGMFPEGKTLLKSMSLVKKGLL